MSMPIAKYDKKGRLVCPTCEMVIPIPETHWLGKGPGTCPNVQWRGGRHQFWISEEVSYAINDIRSKSNPDGEQKRLLKTFEEIPREIRPEQDGGVVHG